MKTQQSTTVPTAVCPFGAQTPINPVFANCLKRLHDVFREITDLCEDETNPHYDTLGLYHEKFYNHIEHTANSIGQMAQVDLVERNFYVNKPIRKEACNA